MLEPVPRTSSQQPHPFIRWVSIHNEMIIRCLLILAHSCLHQRCMLHGREAHAQILADRRQPFRTDRALAARGVERLSTRVVGDFEPASVVAGNTVAESVPVLGPDRQTQIIQPSYAGGNAEEKNVLLGGP